MKANGRHLNNPDSKSEKPKYKWEIKWHVIFILLYIHYTASQGLIYIFTSASYLTILWQTLFFVISVIGTGAGAHRLWAHRAYKANLPLRIILCIFQTIAFQTEIYEWAYEHRVHHKFTDTDADPYNSSRGFFFAHVGWAMLKKHEDVAAKAKTLDLSDLESDWIVMFQKKYWVAMGMIIGFILPTWVAWYAWNEDFYVSWCITMVRYVLNLHSIFSVNSAAHMWGMKPYDKNISPVENMSVSYLSFGEGFHNYHHTFPWDYKAAELSNNYANNMSAHFIELMAKIGWAYELKTVSPEMIARRKMRTGDNSKNGHMWELEDNKDINENNKRSVFDEK